jgi:UDP-glucose:(heptosyl)LPS alpha-1,3-glucosyltransferase
MMVRGEIARRFGVPDSRLRVIPNGVDSDRFRPRDAGEAREALGVPREQPGPVWLLAGSGLRRKGLDTAIAALAASSGKAELWVAGGDAPEPWQALATRLGVADRVRFLGPRSDMEHIYPAADALLLPTRYDAFANVCLEAAACGLPVVTSRHNGSAEAIGDGAIVVDDAEDVAGFASALERMAAPDVRRELGERALAAARACSWARHVEQLRALYRDVAR